MFTWPFYIVKLVKSKTITIVLKEKTNKREKNN